MQLQEARTRHVYHAIVTSSFAHFTINDGVRNRLLERLLFTSVTYRFDYDTIRFLQSIKNSLRE